MAEIQYVDGVNYRSSYASGEGRIPVQVLQQDDFLKLLVTQMTTQDPLSPQTDFDFIAQMSSFTSLEQTRTMQSELSQLRQDQEVLKANALIGRTVDVLVDSETHAWGVVNAVQMEAGKPKVVVGDQSYGLDQIQAITATPAPN